MIRLCIFQRVKDYKSINYANTIVDRMRFTLFIYKTVDLYIEQVIVFNVIKESSWVCSSRMFSKSTVHRIFGSTYLVLQSQIYLIGNIDSFKSSLYDEIIQIIIYVLQSLLDDSIFSKSFFSFVKNPERILYSI